MTFDPVVWYATQSCRRALACVLKTVARDRDNRPGSAPQLDLFLPADEAFGDGAGPADAGAVCDAITPHANEKQAPAVVLPPRLQNPTEALNGL